MLVHSMTVVEKHWIFWGGGLSWFKKHVGRSIDGPSVCFGPGQSNAPCDLVMLNHILQCYAYSVLFWSLSFYCKKIIKTFDHKKKKSAICWRKDLASASALTLSRADEYSDPTRHARATAVVLPLCNFPPVL